MRVVLKVTWLWPTMSEVDFGGMEVEADCLHQYSFVAAQQTLCCCATDGSRVWQNGVWHRRTYDVKEWIALWRKICAHWLSLILTEFWWRPNIGCEHRSSGWCISVVAKLTVVTSVGVGGVFCLFVFYTLLFMFLHFFFYTIFTLCFYT